VCEGHGPSTRRRPHRWRVGASVSLALFGFIAWSALSTDLSQGAEPFGFDFLLLAAVAGILVSCRLSQLSAAVFTARPGRDGDRLDYGSATAVASLLLLPGGALWFAQRIVRACRDARVEGRKSRAGRTWRTALWAVWALAGTTGQGAFAWGSTRPMAARPLISR